MVRTRPGLAAALLLCLAAAPRLAAQDFDYFLLAVSWTPSFCAVEGDARGREQCARGAGHGYTLHGLWPQFERGWPEWCEGTARDPSRGETAAMADVMGSAGLAWHQWRKHGRCTGAGPAAYFSQSRAAYRALDLPETIGRTTPAALAEAVLARNPGLHPEGLVVTCREGYALDLRFCLSRELEPRACAPDVLARACAPRRSVVLPPPR
ncbi:ribonuclease T2 [soil metagenome]